MTVALVPRRVPLIVLGATILGLMPGCGEGTAPPVKLPPPGTPLKALANGKREINPGSNAATDSTIVGPK